MGSGDSTDLTKKFSEVFSRSIPPRPSVSIVTQPNLGRVGAPEVTPSESKKDHEETTLQSSERRKDRKRKRGEDTSESNKGHENADMSSERGKDRKHKMGEDAKSSDG